MLQWWKKYNMELPEFDKRTKSIDKKKIEEMTGCVPLFLNPLRQYKGRNYLEIETEYWSTPDLVRIDEQVKTHAQEMAEKLRQAVDMIKWNS